VTRINLYGFLDGDVLGRVLVADDGRTVRELADQLCAWVPSSVPVGGDTPVVTDEQGTVLDLGSTLAEAGLGPGDIFRVGGVPL
jgi:hypothetical protein